MGVPKNLLYTKEHEWVKIEGDVATVGITDYAQRSLVDITFIEFPEKDKEVKQFEQIATVESVKAVSDIYSPLTGQIVEVNEALTDSPEVANQDPYEKGWLFKLKFSDENEKNNLMKSEDYEKYLKTLEE